MNKKWQMGIMLLVIAVLLAAFLLLRDHNQKQKEKENNNESEETIEVISGDMDAVTALVYPQAGENISLLKVDGIWKAKEDLEKALDQSKINMMLVELVPFLAKREITDVKDYAQYGLDDAQKVIITMGEKTYRILVGDLNELTGDYYVKLDDSDVVYIVESKRILATAYSLQDLIVEDKTEDEID